MNGQDAQSTPRAGQEPKAGYRKGHLYLYRDTAATLGQEMPQQKKRITNVMRSADSPIYVKTKNTTMTATYAVSIDAQVPDLRFFVAIFAL